MFDKKLLEATLYQEIPMTSAMGIKVKIVDENSVTLTAPLDKNINHKHTAFGGSLYSIAVLSGWSLLHVKLQRLNISAHIVIQEGKIKYIHPVTTEIEATVDTGSAVKFQRFIQMYQKKGIARIQLHAVIKQSCSVAVDFFGSYVIHD